MHIRMKKNQDMVTEKHFDSIANGKGKGEKMEYMKDLIDWKASHGLKSFFFLIIIIILLTEICLAEQTQIIEAAPGQPIGNVLTLGGDSGEITIGVSPTISDWILDPTEPLCTRETTLEIDCIGPWRITVSADVPAHGHMAEYDTSNSAYVPNGIRLKNSMIVIAKGGNWVDLSHGGVLLDGDGRATVPLTFIQNVSLDDKSLPSGNIYQINIIFKGLKL